MLDVQGKCFGNLPPSQQGYISRDDLENELLNGLMNDRHPLVTLAGRGGIGKTWLTLTVLHKITETRRFDVILWFSARDIDLKPEGPKLVAPQVLTVDDISKEIVSLLAPTEAQENGFKSEDYLGQMMTKSDLGPMLFVFDNFETVRSPSEIYTWIDTYIRLPNKVLITTRFREFRGDYPIEVKGMTETESDELIASTAEILGIDRILTTAYKNELYHESVGHPYVMKVLLGEVAKAGKLVKVDRIVASIDDILDALFERTYTALSPVARRVFLTLCSWRSAVPLLALEAVLLRPTNERMDIAKATEELSRSAFVETSISIQDNERFITVPLVAAVFGKRKLATSPMKSAIESDLQLLHVFGATQQSDIQKGVTPRIERLFQHIAAKISQGTWSLDDHIAMLEFIARKFPPAWLLLQQLYVELDTDPYMEKAKEAVRRYIEAYPETDTNLLSAWEVLEALCRQTNDASGEIQSLVEISQLPGIPFQEVSNAINRVNALFVANQFAIDSYEKEIISQRLAEVMESRIKEGDATDCSRLAWLYIRLQLKEKAREIVRLGLNIFPDNMYCQNLANKLGVVPEN